MERGHTLFWDLAEPWLARPEVSRSTMMGFPCLRVDGQFFASVHREGTHLVVKLPADRVRALVAAGDGEAFAPNGRVFREWLAVPVGLHETWDSRIEEAYAFVGGA